MSYHTPCREVGTLLLLLTVFEQTIERIHTRRYKIVRLEQIEVLIIVRAYLLVACRDNIPHGRRKEVHHHLFLFVLSRSLLSSSDIVHRLLSQPFLASHLDASTNSCDSSDPIRGSLRHSLAAQRDITSEPAVRRGLSQSRTLYLSWSGQIHLEDSGLRLLTRTVNQLSMLGIVLLIRHDE